MVDSFVVIRMILDSLGLVELLIGSRRYEREFPPKLIVRVGRG